MVHALLSDLQTHQHNSQSSMTPHRHDPFSMLLETTWLLVQRDADEQWADSNLSDAARKPAERHHMAVVQLQVIEQALCGAHEQV